MPEINIIDSSIPDLEGSKLLMLAGSVDAYNSEILSTRLEELLEKGCYKLVINCAGLKFISSSGMGVFMSIEDDLAENHGGLKFVAVPDKIMNVFQKVGLSDIFRIYPDEAGAVADFKKGI